MRQLRMVEKLLVCGGGKTNDLYYCEQIYEGNDWTCTSDMKTPNVMLCSYGYGNYYQVPGGNHYGNHWMKNGPDGWLCCLNVNGTKGVQDCLWEAYKITK
mgnify:CR=1 FL=1|jgi:hypothetical protein